MKVEVSNSEEVSVLRENAEILKRTVKSGIRRGAKAFENVLSNTFGFLDSILNKKIRSENIDELDSKVLKEIAEKYKTDDADGVAVHMAKDGSRIWMLLVRDKTPLTDDRNIYVIIHFSIISQELSEILGTEEFIILSF